ncbi:TMAO reductase system periplasmic protein TorT [Mesorhizobium sp. VNQ89]|uniref:TMAO reductase system periplasmic protein TorT n=1 Tax=Mesorhizobium quangtriensis TaxID=3157709 RepID=UPI0032B77AA7
MAAVQRWFFLVLSVLWPTLAQSADAPWRVDAWTPPFDYSSEPAEVSYMPLATAKKPWRICASYPHIKDPYWLSVNYGMVEHARRLGVKLSVVEAGGYPNLERQIAQISECSANADTLIVGTVSYDGLTPTIRQIAQRIPVIAAVNDINSDGITAKSAVSWTTMGSAIGAYFAQRHPKGRPPVKVAWFPGPRGAGWVTFVEDGLLPQLADSAAVIVATKFGDTGFEAQLLLLEEVLEEHPDIDYIIGSAVTADAAVSLLRAKGLSREIRILADYFTHGTYRAIRRGKVLAAPTDSPVLQGKIAVDQAVRALEGSLSISHAGPVIRVVDQISLPNLSIEDSLAPAWFKPTFVVE